MRDICSDWDQDVETLADSALEDLEETVSWFTGSVLSTCLGQTLGVINLLTKTGIGRFKDVLFIIRPFNGEDIFMKMF